MKTNGLPRLQGQLHDLGDLEGVDFAGGAAEDGEVLAGEVDEPAVDGGGAGDDAVGGDLLAGQAEVDLAVLGEQADLLEAAGIDEGVDALAGGQLARAAFCLARRSAPPPCLEALAVLAEVLDQVLHRFPLLGCPSLASSFLRSVHAGSTVTLWDLSPILTW